MNIFIAKLSPTTSGEDLHELFSNYGEVTSAKVIMDRDTGRSKLYGFVEMAEDDDGYKAIEALNESEFDNTRIVVKKSQPKPSGGRDNRFSGDRDRRNSRFRSGNSY